MRSFYVPQRSAGGGRKKLGNHHIRLLLFLSPKKKKFKKEKKPMFHTKGKYVQYNIYWFEDVVNSLLFFAKWYHYKEKQMKNKIASH